MGYYTNYSAEIFLAEKNEKTIEDAEKEIIAAFKENNKFSFLHFELDTLDEIFGYESMKWYDYREDMIEISKKVPYVKILIHGEGEEAGDIWNHWFHNGKDFFAPAIITYENPTSDF